MRASNVFTDRQTDKPRDDDTSTTLGRMTTFTDRQNDRQRDDDKSATLGARSSSESNVFTRSSSDPLHVSTNSPPPPPDVTSSTADRKWIVDGDELSPVATGRDVID